MAKFIQNQQVPFEEGLYCEFKSLAGCPTTKRGLMKKQFFLFYLVSLTIYLTVGALQLTATAQVVTIPDPIPPPRSVRDAFELDPFYQQWIDVDGFPVLGSTKVNPYALKETAWLIRQMIGNRQDLINVFVQKKVHFVIMAHNEVLSDIPEFSPNHVDFLVYNIRGEGGTAAVGHPTPTTGEENVLTARTRSILIHELGHVVHRFGLTVVDPTFDNRLQSAYDTAMANGLWQGTYAASNSWEYWAEGTHAWFYPKGKGSSFNNYGNTRSALKAYDPGLAALLMEIYGDTQWRYTPPAVRLDLPHLQGFNPQDAPTFQPSQELVETYEKFRNPNSDGEGKWMDLRPYDPSFLHNLNDPRVTGSHTMIAFINLTEADILLYPVWGDGTARFWKRLPSHQLQWTPTRPGAVYLIKDSNGKNLALFQAVKKTGRALITPTLNLITPGLSKVSGDNQAGVSGASLPKPFVIEVRDQNFTVLEGISVAFTVTAGNGTLSVTHATTDANGQAESRFTLGASLGTHTVSVAAAGVGQSVVFNATAEAAVAIPDPNLRAVVLTALNKPKNDLITPSELATLTRLAKRNANISNLTGLESATNLTTLDLDENNITDISPVVGLTNLTWLLLGGNNISDISGLAGLTNLTGLSLYNNNISDISAVTELTNLTTLWLSDNNISDLLPLVQNTGLGTGDTVDVRRNPLNELSIQNHIPALQDRGVTVEFDRAATGERVNIPDPNLRAAIERILGKASGGPITTVDMARLPPLAAIESNISDLTGLEHATHLIVLFLFDNNITDLSPLAGLTNLNWLELFDNNITDISPLAGLTNLAALGLSDNNISDLSPLVKNTGLGSGDEVNVDGNPLSYTSINTHIPTLRSRGVVVSANNLKPPTLEYLLSVSVGLNLIHVPLQVSVVDGVAKTLTSISDLYDALGGVDKVNFLITYDTSTQDWLTYFGVSDRGTTNDKTLTYAMGILAGMKTPTSVRLTGKPLGNNGTSIISLNQGLNVVGLPLRDSRINRVSDLLNLDGIQGNVPVVIVTVDGDFKSVGRAGDPGDIPITGGQGFLLTVQRAARVTLSGEGWTNDSVTAAPQILTRLPVRHTTPVLALRGSIIDEATGANRSGFRVAVKNLSTGRQVATTAGDAEAGYRLAMVDIKTMRAAQVGDTLEISAQSTNPFIGVEPLRYAMTAEDVLQGWIQLPALVAYEIPKETELLANYPNPFNPETWIPYRLAEDAEVSLTIYDANGQLVRTIDVGHRVAAVYERRSKAIYWDGRNNLGEQVASGVYFYHLSAGDYSQTRKMLILK